MAAHGPCGGRRREAAHAAPGEGTGLTQQIRGRRPRAGRGGSVGALEGSAGAGGGRGAAVTFGCRRGPAVKVTRDTRGLPEASRERARPGPSTRGAASRGRPQARRFVNCVN